MCRAFVIRCKIQETEDRLDIEMRLDEIVWADHLGVHKLSEAECAWIWQSRYLMARGRFEHAVAEFQRYHEAMDRFLDQRLLCRGDQRKELTVMQAEAILEVTRRRAVLKKAEEELEEMTDAYEDAFAVSALGPMPD